jgi:hypothetical protein
MHSIVDLHLHTTASDGTDTPQQLLAHLEELGITVFSVTDHDTDRGALELEPLVSGRKDLCFYRGIEFSCITPVHQCHILGYLYQPDHPTFQALLAKGRALRAAKMRRRIEVLRDRYQIVFTEEQLRWLAAQESAGKPHLAALMTENGSVSSRAEAFDLLRQIRTPGDKIDAAEAVRGILSAGGVPVWAHPLGGEGERRLTQEVFLQQLDLLCGAGIRGLECCYSRYRAAESAALRAAAEQRGLLISGGSDYHGKAKDIRLGTLCREEVPVDPGTLTILDELDRRKKAETAGETFG